MPEIYINIAVVLVVFVVINFIRKKYSDKLSINIRKGIYFLAIAYFLFAMFYYFNKSADNTRRIVSMSLAVGLIGYFVYKIKTLGNKST